jgi:hypothetical protein
LVAWVADILDVLSAVGGLGGLLSIMGLAYWLGRRFAQIDEKFARMDERFARIDERFRQIDGRFEQVDGRLGGLEASLKAYIDEKFNSLRRSVKSVNEFMVDFLSYEGVLRKEASELLRREMSRVLSVNPIVDVLTEGERRRLKELLEKDELTLEEADELYRIADKLVEEVGDKYTEVWKLLWYSRFWIGYNLRKQRERGKEEKRG